MTEDNEVGITQADERPWIFKIRSDSGVFGIEFPKEEDRVDYPFMFGAIRLVAARPEMARHMTDEPVGETKEVAFRIGGNGELYLTGTKMQLHELLGMVTLADIKMTMTVQNDMINSMMASHQCDPDQTANLDQLM